MEGPKVQQPQVLSPVIQSESNVPSFEYATFFNVLQIIAFYSTRSGTTAERPTGTTGVRWKGMPYFDISLSTNGMPIYLAIPSTNVWVDALGTPR
jgi:hypothetical protein